MLREIAEFAGAEAWRGDGSLSMPDWLVAHCHVSRSRARKLSEAAARVGELPALSDALSDGRLTLDVFAPLADVATPETDAELARASEHWTPDQAHRLATDMKGATDAESAAQFRRRFVRFDDQRCLLWAQLTKDSSALVKAAVIGRARRHDHPSTSDPTTCASRAAAPMRCSTSASNVGGGARAVRAVRAVRAAPGTGAARPRWSSTRTWTVCLWRWIRPRLHRGGGPHLGRGCPPPCVQRADHDVVRRSRWHLSGPEGTAARSLRCTAHRDPASRRRLPVPRVHLPQRDRRPSRGLGFQTGSDGHVQPVDPLRGAPQPCARTGLEARRRCTSGGPLPQPAGMGLCVHPLTDLETAAEMIRRPSPRIALQALPARAPRRSLGRGPPTTACALCPRG